MEKTEHLYRSIVNLRTNKEWNIFENYIRETLESLIKQSDDISSVRDLRINQGKRQALRELGNLIETASDKLRRINENNSNKQKTNIIV